MGDKLLAAQKMTGSKPSAGRRNRLFRIGWWLRKPLTAVLSTILALGVSEFVVRYLDIAPKMQSIRLEDDSSPYVRSHDPVLRYELRPGFRSTFSPQHGYLRTQKADFAPGNEQTEVGVVTVNSHGLRDVEHQSEKSPGVQRIVLLGDSVVELINYVSDEKTIARQLEQQFDAGATEVINCGVSGYCTLAEVTLLRKTGLLFKPDQVVVLFVENDFWGFNLEHTLGGGTIERPWLVQSLFEQSHLFRQTSLVLNLFQFRDELVPSEWHRRAVGDNNVVRGFELLRELATEHKFEVLVAIWPAFTETGIEDRVFLPDKEDLVVEHLAWSQGFPTIRLSRAFQDHWRTQIEKPSPKWFYSNGDEMHPSPTGCRVAAVALHEAVTAADPATAGVRFGKTTDNRASVVAQSLAAREEADSMATRIAWVLRRQNRHIEAEHYYKRIASNPDVDFESVFRDGPNLLQEYHDAGVQLLATNHFYPALDIFQRAVAVDPNHVSSHYHLGLTLARLEQWSSASNSFERVLQIDPTHADALKELNLARDRLREKPASAD